MQRAEEIKNKIYTAVSSDKLSHAYIISRGNADDRYSLASELAGSLLCDNHGVRACEECPSCKKVAAGTHPDLFFVTHEKPASIGVDDIRKQVSDNVDIRPFISDVKIFIIDEAELMTAQAQNALLKTIEEPPKYVIIMLLVSHEDALLDTIRSRCVSLKLSEDAGPDDEYSEENAEILRRIRRMDMSTLLGYVAKLREREGSLESFLDYCRQWYRDVLVYKTTGDESLINIRSEAEDIRRLSDKLSFNEIDNSLSAIDKAAERLKYNVNADLSLELMMLSL